MNIFCSAIVNILASRFILRAKRPGNLFEKWQLAWWESLDIAPNRLTVSASDFGGGEGMTFCRHGTTSVCFSEYDNPPFSFWCQELILPLLDTLPMFLASQRSIHCVVGFNRKSPIERNRDLLLLQHPPPLCTPPSPCYTMKPGN